jgi:hypothetical protein
VSHGDEQHLLARDAVDPAPDADRAFAAEDGGPGDALCRAADWPNERRVQPLAPLSEGIDEYGETRIGGCRLGLFVSPDEVAE